jgi:hypothetical protein
VTDLILQIPVAGIIDREPFSFNTLPALWFRWISTARILVSVGISGVLPLVLDARRPRVVQILRPEESIRCLAFFDPAHYAVSTLESGLAVYAPSV